MDSLSKKVKDLLKFADEKEKGFLRGNLSEKQIQKEIDNYNFFIEGYKLEGSRPNLAEIHEDKKNIIGYNSFTIMNNANSTPYERIYMDMGSGLNYLMMRNMFVHPKYREKGIANKFLMNNISIAKELNKHIIIDVDKNNYKMINLLDKHDFSEDFQWSSPNGKELLRYFHE